MSVEDKEKLQLEMREKVLLAMAGAAGVIEHIEYTLNNFSYRYLESDSTGELTCSLKADDTYSVVGTEGNLGEALKTKNTVTRKGLIDLAKSFSKKDQPCVRYEIGVKVINIDSRGGGDFLAFAEVNWDFPDFNTEGRVNRNEKKLSYEDAIDLRNNFARELDDLCEVF
jgi:hypothetical protein